MILAFTAVKEEVFAEWFGAAADVGCWDQPAAACPTVNAAPQASDKSEEHADAHWLADELLERVFSSRDPDA